MQAVFYLLALLVLSALLIAGACADGTQPTSPAAAPPPARVQLRPTILLAQAQFIEKKDAAGKVTESKPGAARLVILRQLGDTWQPEVLEDPESNVFHRAAFFTDPTRPDAGPGILTIGANAAAVKVWRKASAGWTAETLWKTEFGGKQNRLRDIKLGDVTGDGKLDLVIATHDQGVVAVLRQTASGWEPIELDRKPRTFVHEVELGDLDGDGCAEIYATPSRPNRFDGTPQPGEIVCYYNTPQGFQRRVVEEFPLRHVKEILVTEDAGDGRPALLASVEAELAQRVDAPPDAARTLVKRYRFENGRYEGEVVCTLPDGLCRFFNLGDVDGDGRPELIASTHKGGIWLARPGPGPWSLELIDGQSSGFEHATVLADLDQDGRPEIYVAADDQRQVRRYRWDAGRWQRDTLAQIEEAKITFGISAARSDQ